MEFLLLITIAVVIILAVIFIDAFIDARFPNFNFALKLLDLIKNIFQLFIVLSLIFSALSIILLVIFWLYEWIIYFIEGKQVSSSNILLPIVFYVPFLFLVGFIVIYLIPNSFKKVIEFFDFILNFVIKFFNKKK